MSEILRVRLERLRENAGNPNRMSAGNFHKLVRNIERTGRYEPIVVRPCGKEEECFEIINGHHRAKALRELGYRKADCVVWEVDDEETEILLATLNRLGGTDIVSKKRELLRRLNESLAAAEMARIMPLTKRQIERLINFTAELPTVEAGTVKMANATVFFLDDEQKGIIEEAIAKAEEGLCERSRAKRKVEAMVRIAKYFLGNKEKA